MSKNKMLQRGLAILLAVLLLAGTLTTAGLIYSNALEYAKGDLDGDGIISISDVMEACKIIARASAGQQEDERLAWAADMDEDQEVNISDVMELCKAIARGDAPGAFWPSDELVSGEQYILVAQCSRKLLSVENSSLRNRGNVYQWRDTGSDSQRWLIEDAGDGYYKLTNVGSGLVLDVDSSSPDPDANVWQYAWNGSTAQKWRFTRDEDGAYRIQAACAPECSLSVSQGSAEDGANVLQWTSDDRIGQKWYLRRVEPQDAAPTPALADAAFDAWVEQFYVSSGPSDMVAGSFTSDFWKGAEMFEIVLDAYERTGSERHKAMIDECYRGFIYGHGENWEYNGFNDDIMWITIACARAYNATGNQTYLEQAKRHFDAVFQRAWDTSVFGGGLFWTTDNSNKNSCINGPAMIAACLLGEALGDDSYYDKAIQIYEWQRANLVETETGRVYDAWNLREGGDPANQEDYELNAWASTYNQGTWIGGCTMLYEKTGEQKYFDDAKLAADYTMNEMYRNGVINTEGGSNQDLWGFKGILTRWLGYFIRTCDQDQYTEWLQLNAKVAWNNRNADNVVQTQWGTKTGDTGWYNAWHCSGFVSLMQNCPMPTEEPAAAGETQQPQSTVALFCLPVAAVLDTGNGMEYAGSRILITGKV